MSIFAQNIICMETITILFLVIIFGGYMFFWGYIFLGKRVLGLFFTPSLDLSIKLNLSLMTSVMCCNGSPTVGQLDIIKRYIRKNVTSEDGQQMALKLVQKYMKSRYTIETVVAYYGWKSIEDRKILLRKLLQIAYADHGYDVYEKFLIWRIAKQMKLEYLFNGKYTTYSQTTTQQTQSSNQYENNNSGYQGSAHQSSSSSYTQTSSWDYALLGIKPEASNDEVKKAYRKLVMLYHPDRLTGKSDAEKKVAAQKFDEITSAYDSIRNQRGMK